jgi:hypothetical protein
MNAELPKSRKGHPRHATNPSVEVAASSQKVGVKRVAGKDGMSLIVSDQNTGEIIAPVGFHQRVPVDKTQFVKMYIQGIRALQGITLSGVKVFELIFNAVQENPGTDRIMLHFMDTLEDGKPKIPSSTFHRGLKELLDKEFIYESMVPNMYWINLMYMFNGDRFAFIKEYYISDTPSQNNGSSVKDRRQGELL